MLNVYRFTQSDVVATHLETFKNYHSLGVRWSLPGGVQRIELVIKVNNRHELYERMNTHAGQRIAIHSPQMTRPVAGWIYEVNSVGSGAVQYVAFGAWRRLKDVYDVTVYDPTDTTGEVLTTALVDHCLFYNGDSSGIQITGNEIGGWQVADEIGSTLQDLTQDMIDMSDSSYRLYDFLMLEEPLTGITLRQMVPYFGPRITNSPINWQVDISDLAGLNTGMGIVDTFSNITIFYNTVGGNATGGSATTLIDSGAAFTTSGLSEGDRVVNEDDKSAGRIDTIDSATQLTISALSGGTANVFASGNAYSITLQNMQSVTANAAAVNGIFTKFWREVKRGFNVTQATSYANMLLTQKNAYQQQSPFAVNSRIIKDGNGARWPLLEIIARGGGYLRINDLYPEASLFSTSMNNSTSFFITALDYDHVSGQMRVVVDNPDRRLDVRLFTAGILNGEMVGRG